MGIDEQDELREAGRKQTTHIDLPGTAALEVLGAAVLPRSMVDVLSVSMVVSVTV